MHHSKLSVVIPMYNTSRFIEDCIQSVLNQNYNNIEIIIIDDCSIDDSYQRVQDLYGKHPSVRIEQMEINSGAGGARNRGLSLASGEYISFLDSDDAWHSSFIELMLTELINTNSNIVSCLDSRFSDAPNISSLLEKKSFKSITPIESLLLAESACKKIYKIDYLRENNIRFPEYMTAEDALFTPLSLSFAGTIRHIDLPLYLYRLAHSTSVTKSGKAIEDGLNILSQILSHPLITNEIKIFMTQKKIVGYIRRNATLSPRKALAHIQSYEIISTCLSCIISENGDTYLCGKDKQAWASIYQYLLTQNRFYLIVLYFRFFNRLRRLKRAH
ncbi:glycosyltransferase [Vibrio sp. SM6]|uniref:Glycosyltransferase n=1 Tax=Vibrio agarilyticus TaxID=2726741 RepID=A0A7X8TU64_9VIBR|nr:glycosyltransferase [Vibrio agarilyticus]NLS14582.1 glycosyltransferase [Vibrio agarilyticus]